MGWFNLDSDTQDRIDAMPGTTDVPPPGALEGLASAVPKGATEGAVKVGAMVSDTEDSITDWLARHGLGPSDTDSFYTNTHAFGLAPADAEEQRAKSAAAVKIVSDWAATGQDPRKTGVVGRIASGTAEGLSIGLAGNAVAGPWGAAGLLGTTEGHAAYSESRTQGVDETTALEQGGLTGAFSALGAFLPLKYGKTLASTILGGVGANVTLGAAQRGLTSQVLADHGYKDMAGQYRVFDGEAMAADTILGAAFGVMGHYSHGAAKAVDPADVDAAAAVATEEHFNRSAPGVPTDPATATIHADTMADALRALADGDLPDIPADRAQQLVDNVVPDPIHDTAAPLHEAAKAELPGFAEAAADIKPDRLSELKPAPLWSAIWDSTWKTADYLTTGGLVRSIVEDTGNPERVAGGAPLERGAPWSEQSQGRGVPLDTFHDALLGDLVHNHGDEVYEYRHVRDIDGTHVEPVTYRQMAEEMQAQRDEIDRFAELHDVAAACFVRHGMGEQSLPTVDLRYRYDYLRHAND
jgi:hypothetical protein